MNERTVRRWLNDPDTTLGDDFYDGYDPRDDPADADFERFPPPTSWYDETGEPRIDSYWDEREETF